MGINTGGLMWAGGKAFLIVLVLTPIVRDIFRSYNVVDRPGRRKVHRYPIPRVGGIPIAIAYVVSLISSSSSSSLPGQDLTTWKLLPGVAVIFLVGLLDDFFNLRPVVKLLGQMLAVGMVFAYGLRIETVAQVSLPMWLSLPVTVLWLLLVTNALNLIDGLDGLCAGMGLLATLTLFGAAWIQGNYALAHATFPLVGALLGFLGYNFNPATVFLGDAGAMLIGFLLGCYGMIWTQKTATLLSVTVPIVALSIPLMDVLLSVVRRYLHRQPIFSADRGHIHHRLLDRGLSPRRAVLVLYLIATIGATFALLLTYPLLRSFHGILVAGLFIAIWASIRQLRYAEFVVAGRLLFRGEFQRALEGKLRLEKLAAALRRSNTQEEVWDVLANACKEAGWVRLKWTGNDFAREYVAAKQIPTWSFVVVLGEQGEVQIEGGLPSGQTSVDLVAFADTLSSSMNRTRQELRPATLS